MASSPADRLAPGRVLTLTNVADGAEGLVVADLARAVAAKPNAPATSLLVICRDGPRLAQLARALKFFGPDVVELEFPAWDCQPYDRVSPHAGVVAQRMTTLSRLARLKGRDRPSVLLTTVNAVLQRVPAKELLAAQALSASPGNVLRMDDIVRWLELNGFVRASTVREPGEYAVRGGILDLFPPGMDQPVRLDFFGDTLESIRTFDPETQRTTDQLRALDLVPVAEFQLTSETIRRFRLGYVEAFGAATPDDQLYQAVSEGRRYPGMEHWLPLFHTKLDTLFDYLPGTPVVLEPLAGEAAHERIAQIVDYYNARKEILGAAGGGAPYKPLPPDRLYFAEAEWQSRLAAGPLVRLTPFAAPEGTTDVIDAATRPGRNFAPERTQQSRNVFEAVKAHVEARQAAGDRVVVALWSEGARDRMRHVLADHGLLNLLPVANWQEARARPKSDITLAVLGLESGFETTEMAVIAE
ncbi:MAG: transcription-repair coupling factor, partial [Xanthobacteraceae bacterium]